MTGFVILGAVAAVLGLALLVTAISHQKEQRPRYAAMLIGGMMMTAFGVVIAGFALVYSHTGPIDLNAAEGQ